MTATRGWCDVGFGVEFALGVDPALDFALLHGLNDGGGASQQIVGFFLFSRLSSSFWQRFA